MTCRQLGGACDLEFRANSFEEMAAMSQTHGKEMFQTGDQAHLQAMAEMKILMQLPNAMSTWMEKKKSEFDALSEDE